MMEKEVQVEDDGVANMPEKKGQKRTLIFTLSTSQSEGPEMSRKRGGVELKRSKWWSKWLWMDCFAGANVFQSRWFWQSKVQAVKRVRMA